MTERYAPRRGAARRTAALADRARMTVAQQLQAVAQGLLSVDEVSPEAAQLLANREALAGRARDAVVRNQQIAADCGDYLAIPSPSAAQAVAHVRVLSAAVRALARHQSALIRLSLDMLDETD